MKKRMKSVNTYDFSSLYTSIPHDQLQDNLRKFITRVFDFKQKPFVIPNIATKRAYFSAVTVEVQTRLVLVRRAFITSSVILF